MADIPPSAASTPITTQPQPRRRRRWWLWAIVAVVAIVVLLILLAPTLLSTPPGRSFALGIVNGDLAGKVEIDSWSLGWFTGASASNVRVVDADKQPVAELKQFNSQLTVLDALFGRYALGKARIDGLRIHAKMNADGTWNFQKITKAAPAPPAQPPPPPPPAATAPPPPPPAPGNSLNLSGDITLNDIQADVQQPGDTQPIALTLAVPAGAITDLGGARNVSLTAQLNYDLAKLWPAIHPMLITQGKPDQYADVKLAGAYDKTFHIQGSFPANESTDDAIAKLTADGDLSVGEFDHDGLAIQNLDIPLTLHDGVVTTIFANKPAGQNTAPAATANGGTLDLSNLQVDLKQSPPRLSTASPNLQVVNNLTINPLFSQTFLAKILNNPVFAGAQQATGLFALSIDRCTKLPLGDLVTQRTAANDGSADLRFSLTNLHIGLQGISQLGNAIRQDSFDANVKDGTLNIAGGIVTQHMVFNTGTYNISFDGKVALDTQELMPLTITLPGARIAQQLPNGRDIAKYAPAQIPIVMTGTVSNPQIQLDQVVQQLMGSAAQNAVASNLNKFLGNSGGGANNAASQPSNDNPLDSLINRLQKKKH